MMTRVLMGAMAACAVMVSANTARASQLQIAFEGLVAGSSTGNITFSLNGNAGSGGGGGIFKYKVKSGPNSFYNIKTFCTQIQEVTNTSYQWYDVKSVDQVPDSPPGAMGMLRATVIRDLYSRHYATAIQGGANAQAFQFAIWLIVQNSVAGVNASNLKSWANSLDMNATVGEGSFAQTFFFTNGTGDGVKAIVNGWLAGLGNGGWLDSLEIWGLSNPTYQDQLVVVPVPAPALLAGLGLIGAVAMRRRMTKA